MSDGISGINDVGDSTEGSFVDGAEFGLGGAEADAVGAADAVVAADATACVVDGGAAAVDGGLDATGGDDFGVTLGGTVNDAVSFPFAPFARASLR